MVAQDGCLQTSTPTRADLGHLWGRSRFVWGTISSAWDLHHRCWSPVPPPPHKSLLLLGFARITRGESAFAYKPSFRANKREEIKQCRTNEILTLMAANKQLMLYIKQRLRESIALDILAASACAVGFFPSPLLTIQCENMGGKCVCVRQHYDIWVCFKNEGLLPSLARALYPLDSANLSGNKSLGLTVSINQINTFFLLSP